MPKEVIIRRKTWECQICGMKIMRDGAGHQDDPKIPDEFNLQTEINIRRYAKTGSGNMSFRSTFYGELCNSCCMSLDTHMAEIRANRKGCPKCSVDCNCRKEC